MPDTNAARYILTGILFTVVSKQKIKDVAKMLKAIPTQKEKAAALQKAEAVAEKLRSMRLTKVTQKVEKNLAETLTYMGLPMEHWTRIRTNDTLERLNKESKHRAKVVGISQMINPLLMLVCARLKHVAFSDWENKRYLNMEHLRSMILSAEENDIVS